MWGGGGLEFKTPNNVAYERVAQRWARGIYHPEPKNKYISTAYSPEGVTAERNV
jgi:hypothetical protein